MTIRLAYVDDDPMERRLFEIALRGGEPPFLKDAQITYYERPPDDLRELLGYDLVVLDNQLRGERTGAQIAEALHALDWRIPLLLLTGAQLEELPKNLSSFIDGLAWKDERADRRSAHSMFSAIRVMARRVAAVHDAFERGRQQGRAETLEGKR